MHAKKGPPPGLGSRVKAKLEAEILFESFAVQCESHTDKGVSVHVHQTSDTR